MEEENGNDQINKICLISMFPLSEKRHAYKYTHLLHYSTQYERYVSTISMQK